jgi:cytochrome P450
MKMLQALPDSIAYRTDPAYAMYLAEKKVCFPVTSNDCSDFSSKDVAAQAARAMNSPKSSNTQHRTIFHEILNSKLPPEEMTLARLGDEATTTVAAGTITTAWTLSVAIYYLLTSPSVLKSLKTELENGALLFPCFNHSSPPGICPFPAQS